MNVLDQSIKQAGYDTEARRLLKLSRALQAYDGTLPKPLVVKANEPDDNVCVNYADVVVGKISEALFGDELVIQIGTQEDGEAGDTYLELVWPADVRATDMLDLAENGALFGHLWLKIVIGNNGDPRVVVLDPLNMTAEWDGDDYRQVTLYRCQYNTTDANGRPIVKREDYLPDGNRWVIRFFESNNSTTKWIPTGEQIWPYPFSPVFQEKNLPKASEFYGKPDLTDHLIGLIGALNRLDSLINKIIRNHASPKTIAKGMNPQDLKIGVDQVLFLPRVEQALETLEMTSDLASSLAFRAQLRESIAEISRVPEVATSKMENVGQLSGRALQILYGPLLARTKVKRRLYGRLLASVVKALLMIGKQGDQPVMLKWQELLPNDPREMAETMLLHKNLGIVSQKTMAAKLGYDWEMERLEIALDHEVEREDAAQGDNFGL